MKPSTRTVALIVTLLCLAAVPCAQAGAAFISHPGATPRTIGSNGSDFELPDISAASRAQEYDTLVVQGLGGEGSTDLVVMNLGATAATCSAKLVRADGELAVRPVEISIEPKSDLRVTDFLRNFPDLSGARAEVSCSNEFYVYAQHSDPATGRVLITGADEPSGELSSVFSAVTINPDRLCSTASMVCQAPGTVFIPSKAKTALFLGMKPPVDTYKILRASLDVQVFDFNPINKGGAHGIFWVVINNNKSLVGSTFLRGGGKNNFTLRHGVCPGRVCLKTKVEKSLPPLVPGTIFSFEYEYNTNTKTANLKVSQNGQPVGQIQDKAEVNNLFIYPGDTVLVGLSNPDPKSRVEPPSLGWVYSNVRVELLK
jgi:hypothetical protein